MQIPNTTLPTLDTLLRECSSSIELYFDLSDLEGGLLRLPSFSLSSAFTQNLYSQIKSLLSFSHSE